MAQRLTDRRTFVEQQLFDVQMEIERARHELEVADQRLAAVETCATDAAARLGVAETPLASDARVSARVALLECRAAATSARARLDSLESARDGLLDRLLSSAG
jgi:hypothetical protein